MMIDLTEQIKIGMLEILSINKYVQF